MDITARDLGARKKGARLKPGAFANFTVFSARAA